MAKREMKTMNTEEPKIDEMTPVVEEPKEETANVGPSLEPGIVSGCSKLNIRKKPAVKEDNVIAVVDANTELSVDLTYKNKEWYKVTTKDGAVGYCMKQYVTIA